MRKYLVIGLGSMGKRRVRNLHYLKAGEVLGFDLRADRCQEAREKYGIAAFDNLEDALKEHPDVFIISTPSDRHHHYALMASKLDKHFFAESNFLPEGVDDLVAIGKRKDIVAAPSFTMPHHPSVKLLKKLVSEAAVGRMLCFAYHLGAYLPDWHPWEDYRGVYYSRKETPGCQEMVAFELTWLIWLLGKVKRVFAFKGKLSRLETEIEDVYQIGLEFENNILGNLLVDVVSRPSIREGKFVGEKGTIIWNTVEEELKVFDGETKSWSTYPEGSGIIEPGYSVRTHEEMYIEEMSDFVAALEGNSSYPYSFEAEKAIIEVLQAIEESAEKGISIMVK